MPDRMFQVIVANFSRKERHIPKNMIIGYARRNSIAILAPERQAAVEISRVLNISSLSQASGEENMHGSAKTNVYSQLIDVMISKPWA